MPLRLTTYLTEVPSPLAFVSSARCLLLRDGEVLVLRSSGGTHHLLPGGRREAGDSIAETVRRELLEETGHAPHDMRQLGLIHFHHLAPGPEAYPYPYPDFLWLVHAAGRPAPQPARPGVKNP